MDPVYEQQIIPLDNNPLRANAKLAKLTEEEDWVAVQAFMAPTGMFYVLAQREKQVEELRAPEKQTGKKAPAKA